MNSRKIFKTRFYENFSSLSPANCRVVFQTCPLRSRVLHNRFNKNYLHLYCVLLFKVISTAVVWLFWIGPSEGERGGKFKRRWWLILNWVKTKKLRKEWWDWAESGWFESHQISPFCSPEGRRYLQLNLDDDGMGSCSMSTNLRIALIEGALSEDLGRKHVNR